MGRGLSVTDVRHLSNALSFAWGINSLMLLKLKQFSYLGMFPQTNALRSFGFVYDWSYCRRTSLDRVTNNLRICISMECVQDLFTYSHHRHECLIILGYYQCIWTNNLWAFMLECGTSMDFKKNWFCAFLFLL